MSNSSHTYGTDKNLTANSFSNNGCEFVGWNTKADGTGTSYTDGQSVKNLTSTNGGTVTLYAQWKLCVNTTTDVKYTSVQAAINAAASGQTIQMIANSTESFTVASGKTVTLDLNGKVLKGTGTGRVVTISSGANLTITDSDNSATSYYYTVGSDGLWTWIASPTAAQISGAKAYESLTARPAANDIIAVKGGAITGGKLTSGYGAGIYSTGNLTLKSGNIVGNYSSSAAAGVYLNASAATLTIEGGNICGNSGTMETNGAGAICIDSGNMTMSGGTVSFNRGYGGGALCASLTTVTTITGGAFVGNLGGEGGAMHLRYTTNITDATIASNIATANAGGFVFNTSGLNNSVVTISGNTKFTGNQAGSKGGAMDSYNGGIVVQGNAVISGNTAAVGGGGIATQGTNSALTICGNVQITGNVSSETEGGGGVYIKAAKSVTIGGSVTIKDNKLSDSVTVSNLYLPTDKTITVSTDMPLTAGADIGVTMKKAPTTSSLVPITQACADVAEYFKADNSMYSIFYDQSSQRVCLGGYKLTLDANGAECSTEYLRTIKGSACPTLPELVKAGFYSPGWFDTKQENETDEVPASGKFTSGMNINYSENKTIYCWWKLKFRDDDTSVSDGTVQVKDTNVTVTSDDAAYMMEKAQKSVNVVDMTKAKNVENPSDVIDAIHNSRKLTPNTLIYLPVLKEDQSIPADKAENVVVKDTTGKKETYKCVNFSVTDGVPVSVPYSFNADVATYRRDTSSRWGTVCVPFKLRSDGGIQYYTSGKLMGDQLLWEKADTVAAGCPAVYMVSDIDTTGTGGSTATKKDIVKTDYVKVVGTSASTSGTSVKLVGTFTELVLDDAKVSELGLGSKDIYYYKDNKFYKRTSGQSVTIPALRAYILIQTAQQK